MQKLNWKPKTDLEKAGVKIIQLLNKKKYQAFFVGGAVRDRILKKTSDNLDIATDALPDEVEKVLESANIYYKLIGKVYGTILAVIKGQKLEITTFRSESGYSDQRHPDQVEFIKNYLDDAHRRDFTINALYYNPVSLQLFDPTRGLVDLKLKIIRFVGDPKRRINEDALRMLRAVRLATTLNFRIEKNSFAAIKTRAKFLQEISGERVKQELDKILLSKNRTKGLRLLDSSGLLSFILPEFTLLKKIFHGSKSYHLEGSVYEHTLLVIQSLPADLDLLYSGLFHDLGKLETGKRNYKKDEWVNSFFGHQRESLKLFRNFADKLKFPRQSKDLVSWLILHHDDRVNYRQMKKENQIKYSLHPDFGKLLELWKADSRGNIRIGGNNKAIPGSSESVKIGLRMQKIINLKKSLIEKFSNGNFIMAETKLGPGIRIGELSEKVKIQIVAGEINNLSKARYFLKKFSKSTGK